MTSFWSVFIIVIVVANIAGSAWLLFANARDSSPDKTTGHIWDEDLTEYNKPLPLWWVGLFVGSIVFGIGYLVVYPGLGAFAGVTGWTSAEERRRTLEAGFDCYLIKPVEPARLVRIIEQAPSGMAFT